jgi:CelD/BcsL family acetyltransferase involved in cellulose biosynthesis
VIQVLTTDEWREFDARHPAPTFFARPAWALALQAADPNLCPQALKVEQDGERFIVPLVRASGGALGWRAYVGMPLGGYTCILKGDGSIAGPLESASVLLHIERQADVITVTPWPLAAPIGLPAHAWTLREHETAAIDLAEGLEAALARVAGVTRRMAGQAERRGVTCERDESPSAVDTYYAMLEESSQRWGLSRPPYPKKLLEALVAFGEGDVEVWFARSSGEPIAGGVIFFGADELFFWSAAMRNDHARLRPSNALNIALIRAAAARGLRWYNLGSSEGLPGVERFKKGLGAASISYAELHRQRGTFSMYSKLKSSFRRVAHVATTGA